ncbi:MAG: bifunctional (p)ppGpp synthetase/guanosine-3',5'-bis(diphosphate) 3'-pyrophosphohydrolase [Ruminococcaceae bacterium]|nr:bifunctional (p)ppGpp synthetase/guanosine-3',5'-bis(diphosphate) 3'-pyrophosphohydrolase [Oscillospiraceae bacterium]
MSCETEYKELREKVIKNFTEEEAKVIDKAYNFAKEAHDGQLRYSGQPYIIHPVAVATILVDLCMDYQSVVAALLHDTVEDTDVSLENVKNEYGADIAKLVDGVTKLGKVPLSTKEEEQAENIRKMLLAMSEDIRVIIIKLADRLHNMRTLEFMRPQKRRDKALETIEIYAPLAHRLGIRTIKEELEDLAISFLDPVGYKEIETNLGSQMEERQKFLEDIKVRIRERISEIIPEPHIAGRIKSVHGIYRKMYMQNRSFGEIYDIYAVRIIVDSVIDCYNCLGVIHDMFTPIPGRFKDYISTPKPNMYQSLHTTVIGKEGIAFEVQIRTWEMHNTAEYGIAAHWKYKLGEGSKAKIDERLAWVRQLLESQKESDNVEDIVLTIKSDFVPEEVYVFTPKGDVVPLPAGATVIDFAYAIHSAVGNKMIGAKVDGRIVPIDFVVKTGQIIEVMTSSQQGKGPSRDWLKIVKTSEARTKIRAWFKKERRKENIEEGRAEIEREFKRNRIILDSDSYEEFIKAIAERQHMPTVDDFYAAIGYGGISLIKMLPQIKEAYTKLTKEKAPVVDEIAVTAPGNNRKSRDGVTVENIDNCLIKFAHCCNPLPGDPIIGFITRGHGVSIHNRNCPNVPKDMADAQEPERWVRASWDANIKEDFNATLSVVCIDKVGLLAEISGKFAEMRVMIHNVNMRANKDGRAIMNVTITVGGADHLRNVMAKIQKIDGVLLVERSGI